MRRFALCLFVLIFVFAFGSQEVAFAAEAEKLDGEYFAKFSYSNITSFNNSLIFEFRLAIDTEKLQLLQESADVPLNIITQLFKNAGYSVTEDKGELIAVRKFDSYTDYYIAIGQDGYTLDEDDRVFTAAKKTMLYTWMSYDSPSLFNDITPERLNEQDLIGVTLFILQESGIEIDKVLFEYNYGTPYSNLILDTNAISKHYDKESKIYYHTLLMDINNNSTPLTITRRIPNTQVWYGGAVLAGLAVALIPLMIALIKRKKMIYG